MPPKSAAASSTKHRSPLSLPASWHTHVNTTSVGSSGAKVATPTVAVDDTEGSITGNPVQAGFTLKIRVQESGATTHKDVDVLMDTAGSTLWIVDTAKVNVHDTTFTHLIAYGDGTQARMSMLQNATISLIDGASTVALSSSYLLGKGNLFKKIKSKFTAQPQEVKDGVIGFFRNASANMVFKLGQPSSTQVRSKGPIDSQMVIPSIFDAVRTTFGNGIITFKLTPHAFRDKATVTFGGFPQGTADTDFTWTDVEMSVKDGPDTYGNHWTFKAGIKYGAANLSQSCDVLLDSGCTCIELPPALFKEYKAQVEKDCPSVEASAALADALTILQTEAVNLKSLKLHIGNKDFDISGDAQIWPVALNADVSVPADRVLLRVQGMPAKSKRTMAIMGLPSCMFFHTSAECTADSCIISFGPHLVSQ